MGLLSRLFPGLFGAAEKSDAAHLAQVQASVDRGDAHGALHVAMRALIDAPHSDALLALTSHVCGLCGDAEGTALFSRAASSREDVAAWLELASYLREQDAPLTAAALLQSVLEQSPFDAMLRSELALAWADAGQHERVVQALALHPCLATDAGVLYQFGWSSLLSGDAEAAAGVAEELAQSRAGRSLAKRIERALERASLPSGSEPPDARDYFYLEHGSVLLTRGPERGVFDAFELDDAHLAIFAREAERVLAAIDDRLPPYVCIIGADEQGACARFAAYLGAEIKDMPAHGRAPAWLFIAQDARDLDALHDRLAGAVASGARLLALAMSWRKPHRVVPQMVGAFTQRVRVRLDAKPLEPARPSLAAETFVRDRRDAIAMSWQSAEGDETFAPDFPLPRT